MMRICRFLRVELAITKSEEYIVGMAVRRAGVTLLSALVLVVLAVSAQQPPPPQRPKIQDRRQGSPQKPPHLSRKTKPPPGHCSPP